MARIFSNRFRMKGSLRRAWSASRRAAKRLRVSEAARSLGPAGSSRLRPGSPPSRVQAVARSDAPGHEFSNGKNPAAAGCGIYIKRGATNVSGLAAYHAEGW